MKPIYKLTTEQKMYFSSVLLLDTMINNNTKFDILLSDDKKLLEPIFVHMASKEYVNISNDGYTPTKFGRNLLSNFLSKLTEFRAMYKMYSAVDLGAGEFGYDKYFDFNTDQEFIDYINEPRFEDLRVAVCELKKINPLEIIFMELLDTCRFNTDEFGWESNITTGLIWDEMVEIANSNICLDDLIETDDKGNVLFTGEDIIKMILKEGTTLTQKLIQEQDTIDSQNIVEDVVEETITETYYEPIYEPYYTYDYYDCYYDPYYVSPMWLILW